MQSNSQWSQICKIARRERVPISITELMQSNSQWSQICKIARRERVPISNFKLFYLINNNSINSITKTDM